MIRSLVIIRRALPLLVALTFAGCADEAAPVIRDVNVRQTDNQSTPLAAIVTLLTHEPARIRLDISDGTNGWSLEAEPDYDRSHEIPVFGLRPGREHSFTVYAVDKSANSSVAGPFMLAPIPLPELFPDIRVTVSNSFAMEPGLTLFNLMHWYEDRRDAEYGSLVIVNQLGEVVWFHDAGFPLLDARQLENGNILYMNSKYGMLVEVDMLGNAVSRWHSTGVPKDVPEDSIPVETETFHHEVSVMPNGNFLTLGAELRDFDEYPSSEQDPDAPSQPATVVGDVILEFTPAGDIVHSWSFLDILDPHRFGYQSLDPGFWKPVFGEDHAGALRDWMHANAIIYDDRDHSVIVSSRTQDAVVKVDLDTGELQWILGVPDGWHEPWSDHLLAPVQFVGMGRYADKKDMEWPYHQHAPMITPRGTLLLYDNGNFRSRPFNVSQKPEDSYSRAVEYSINEITMEVSEVWSHGGPGEGAIYSSFISDADWLPRTENVLVTHGGILTAQDGRRADGVGLDVRRSARIMEIKRVNTIVPFQTQGFVPNETVFEMTIDTNTATGGWHVYRAERISSTLHHEGWGNVVTFTADENP